MTGWSEIKKLPKAVWLLNIANVINRMGTMAFLFLGIYLTKELGHPAKVAGLLLGLFGLVSLLITSFGGWLCDHLGCKTVLVGSILGCGTLLLVLPFISSLPLIFVFTLLSALFGECFGPASLTYSTATLPSESKKASLALNRLSHNLGMSVGPALGGFLASISFKWVFWVDGLTAILASLILLFFLPSQKIEKLEKTPSYFKNLNLLSKDKRLRYFLLAGIPLGIGWFQFATVLPLFLVKDAGMTEAEYGFLFTINTIMIVLMEVPLTVKVTQWSYRRVLSLASFLFALGFGLLIWPISYWAVILMVVITTFGEMLAAPSAAAYVSDISPKNREGSYMGIFSSSYGLCASLAPLFGTWILDSYGGQTLWLWVCVLCLISMGLYARVSPTAQT